MHRMTRIDVTRRLMVFCATGKNPLNLRSVREPLIAAVIVMLAVVWGAATASPAIAALAQTGPPAPADPAVSEGARLFVAYNCGDCHGAGGSGAMGPSLQDNRWRFGGSAEAITRSIAEGRPEGMPAWGRLIPPEQMRKLVAYTLTLGEGKDLSTENFTGETVERSGR